MAGAVPDLGLPGLGGEATTTYTSSTNASGTGTAVSALGQAITWYLSRIRSEWRDLTGRSSSSEIADADIDSYINDYYVNYFPEEAGVGNLQVDLTKDVTATDDGDYDLDSSVIAAEEPVTIDGERIALYSEKEQFFHAYPEDEQYIIPPALAIGTSSTAAVAHGAFKYRISGYAYSKAAAETALSGSVVPANKYGAWLLSIDAAGTITVTEATGNSAGYSSPRLAIEGLPDIAATSAIMGFVTVRHTSDFTPGTTGLDTTGAEDTYTDGKPSNRGEPTAALIQGAKLYLRPRPDDFYRFKSHLTLQRPALLTSDSSQPLDNKWGRCLAVGAAVLYIAKQERDSETLTELVAMKDSLLKNIKTKRVVQWSREGRVVQPAF